MTDHHDSGDRLDFSADLLGDAGLHIVGTVADVDAAGEVTTSQVLLIPRRNMRIVEGVLAELAKSKGCEVDSIDYTDLVDEPDARVARLVGLLKEEEGPVILVGSSMGGYVSLVASESQTVAGLFLLAPALQMPGYEKQHYRSKAKRIEIVHGWSDDICDPQHSIDYAKAAGAELHLIEGDHRLNSSLDEVLILFAGFLDHGLDVLEVS